MLYVGTSVNIRSRVRSYFTASEQRTRMAEMVQLAESVTPIVCATTLEAEVRERASSPSTNPATTAGPRPPSAWCGSSTVEAFPRLSIVREVRPDGAHYIGPFGARASAEAAVAAVHEIIPLRQCVQRLSPARPVGACALFGMGRCGAPCSGAQTLEEYSAVAAEAVLALSGDSRRIVAALRERMVALAEQERFEDAGAVRDRLLALVRGMARAQRIGPLAASPEVVAARPAAGGGWELVCVRHGRLAGSSLAPRGANPLPYVEALRAGAEVVSAAPHPAPAGTPEEAEGPALARDPGVRIVDLDGQWTCPVGGAGAARAELEPQSAARHDVAGFVAAS